MYTANVYNIMIASPGDVKEEREIAREIILGWNNEHSLPRRMVLLPLLWEYNSSPSMEGRPQSVINKQVLKNADLLIAVFWTRIGTPTGKAIGGTVEEIEEHLRLGKPVMLYFSNRPAAPNQVDREQFEAVKKIENEYKQRGLIDQFSTVEDFRDKFRRHLGIKLNDNAEFQGFATSDVERSDYEDNAAIRTLGAAAKILLKEGSLDRNGQITKLSGIGGNFRIQTHGKLLNADGGAREKARWTSALDELMALDLVVEKGYQGEIYELTQRGYEVADMIQI